MRYSTPAIGNSDPDHFPVAELVPFCADRKGPALFHGLDGIDENANNYTLESHDNTFHSENYLTTETDPVFSAHPASNVVNSGDGTQYLSDDGTYKTVESGDEGYWEIQTEPAATTEHPRWDDSGDANIYGRDTFGFGALPGGWRVGSGFSTIGERSIWWSATERYSCNAWDWYIYNTNNTISRGSANKDGG